MKAKLVLGVTGGIAAYKAAYLTSALTQAGHRVQVIMTENAQRFVTPLTFETLSQHPVITSLWDTPDWKPEHVALADEAKVLIVAPATANFIAKMAHGIADDALSTFAATFDGTVIIAPAMNPKMWQHPACVQNIAALRARNVMIIEPAAGHVACGAEGQGRLADPQEILKVIYENCID